MTKPSTGDRQNQLPEPLYKHTIDSINGKLEQVIRSGNLVEGLVLPALRLVSADSKHLRAKLLVLIALHGKKEVPSKVLLSAATAIELLHLSSLVHDDIMDEAELRRGVVSVNHKEGEVTALLVGDYLLARSLELAANISGEVAAILSSTFAEMCEGQMQETVNRDNLSRALDEYYDTIKLKTASLVAASCKVGALLGEYDESSVGKLENCGQWLGMSFQLRDDLQDSLGGSGQALKHAGTDLREGVFTLPTIIAAHNLRERGVGLDIAAIRSELESDATIYDSVWSKIEVYETKAFEGLSDIGKILSEDISRLYSEAVDRL